MSEKEFCQYMFIKQSLNAVSSEMEKAGLWLVDTTDTKNFDPIAKMEKTIDHLKDIRKICVYKHKVYYDPESKLYVFK